MVLPSRVVISAEVSPDRADRVLALCLPESPTRSSVARLIQEGRVRRGNVILRPSSLLRPGDVVEIEEAQPSVRQSASRDSTAFTVLYEDEEIVVVDKPAGLAVHPGSGRASGTLMDLLVAGRPEMVGVGEPGRWGIVHRLDRDTSGVIVAAKTRQAHERLSAGFRNHSTDRTYVALVRGVPVRDEGIVDVPIGRHPKDRKRISTSTDKARLATTRWRVQERFEETSVLVITPLTGRTHQIRVHLAYAGLPVLGDQVYGRVRKGSRPQTPCTRVALNLMTRQALHAQSLGFTHPRDGRHVEFSSPLPEDMALVLRLLREGLCPA
ncbi:MAG: RluA family pseudouridine synthase [Thermodesulfobacteriota bacterium]